MNEINEDFINMIRLDSGIGNWVFFESEKEPEIVPHELTHTYLLRNFKIDESIYKYYHLPTSAILSESEFLELKENGFVGEKVTALQPYSMVIYGAYHRRNDLVSKLKMIVSFNKRIHIDGKEIKYFNDLEPYFKAYAEGFKVGFNNFDNDKIKPYLTLLEDKNGYINKVFEYITEKPSQTLKAGFSLSLKDLKNKKYEIAKMLDDGKEQGYLYKAWSVILANPKYFEPLFNKPKPKQKETELSKKVEKLKTIWLAEPKLTVTDFIKKGINKGFWDNDLNILLQRNTSTYGSGKVFLGNIFIAYKGWAIANHLDYKEAGKIFCEVFNIDTKESTKEPYKSFSSGNGKQIAEIKRTFGIR